MKEVSLSKHPKQEYELIKNLSSHEPVNISFEELGYCFL